MIMKPTTQTLAQPVFVRDEVFSGKELIGQRENQEDYSLFRTLGGGSMLLAVMADGMGGHASGEVASKKAVDAFNETFANYPSNQIASKLTAALQQANSQVAQSVREVPALDGMGCTLIAACIGNDGLQWISVGDSLLLLIRGGKIRRLNADHSMMALINESVKSGKMSDAEAKNYPYKNALRSAITGGEIALIDAPGHPFKLKRGDTIILATDGILSLTEGEILSEVNRNRGCPADQIATGLIRAVESKNRPKQDNTSIQVILVPDAIAKRTNLFLLALLGVALILAVAAIGTYYLTQNSKVDIATIVENAFKPKEVKQPQPTAIPEDKADPASPQSSKSSNKSETNRPIPSATMSQKAAPKKSPDIEKKSGSNGQVVSKNLPLKDSESKDTGSAPQAESIKQTPNTTPLTDDK